MAAVSDPGEVLLAYYGDDFTGSTDVMEALSRNGVETLLFLDADDVSQADLDAVDAVGIAGQSRTMSPAEMDDALPSVFERLDDLNPDIVQYKICSTFDSSPEVGSIGRAIDIACEQFDPGFVPVVTAAPSLEPRGRYVVFGNLFATVDGTTHRLDRHPTMRDHPVTPMTEADLTRHLAAQTDRSIGSVTVRDLKADTETLDATVTERTAEHDVLVFDGLDHEDQRTVGSLVWEAAASSPDTTVSASSSGLNYALCAHWHEDGTVSDPGPPPSAGVVDQLVVVSGSASPVNDRQITWALDNGFSEVALETAAFVDPKTRAPARQRAIESALDILDAGGSPLLHSARGPDDDRIEATRQRASSQGIESGEMARRIGEAQGAITRDLLDATDLSRVCVAGGDTSGFVAPYLDIYALEFRAPVGPGSPLCRAHARSDRFDSLEIALKGGQVQTTHDADDYFGVVRDGGDV